MAMEHGCCAMEQFVNAGNWQEDDRSGQHICEREAI
jgi:hypothetical protein